MEPDEIQKENTITLIGEYQGVEDTFENKGEEYKRFILAVKRTSGVCDYIPVVCKASKLKFVEVCNIIKVTGSVRSRNIKVNEKSKLKVYVHANNIELQTEPVDDYNLFSITGFVCKPPVSRLTPSKLKITDIMIAYNSTFNRSFYLPSLAFRKTADAAAELKVGDKITIQGRFQSRDYNKVVDDNTTIRLTAYELAISSFVKEEK